MLGGIGVGATVSLVIRLQGCATLQPRNPLPENLESQVQIPGIPSARAWGDEDSEVFKEFAMESAKQEKDALGKDFLKTPAIVLALSGGGNTFWV
jgi:hypothetical protein